ncbi:hypothetical protein ABBQ38_008232 [Trebouxia sp. C0009 RCD-2024]
MHLLAGVKRLLGRRQLDKACLNATTDRLTVKTRDLEQSHARSQALESEVSKSKSQIQCMEDLLQVTNKELRQTVEQLEVERAGHKEADDALAASNQRLQQAINDSQLEIQAMLPWSVGMKPWFIDPNTLTQSTMLGQSTHAVVYSGTYNRDASLPALQVVLKVLTLTNDVSMTEIEEQVQLIQQASPECPHLCHMYGVTCLQNKACLVMKRHRCTLAVGSSMPMPVVLRHAIDICRGLQELHAQDMAMGSLKPANVLLSDNGTAMLADFGFGRVTDSKKGLTNNTSSDGVTRSARQADIQALAHLLLEMSTGEKSWEAGMFAAKIFDEDVPSNLPHTLIRMIRSCMNTKLEMLPTAEAMLQGLETIQQAYTCQPEAKILSGSNSSADSPSNSDLIQKLSIVPI